jgi:hypothetical protein
MKHYQFFCKSLPSIVVTAESYARASTIAADIYFATIQRFDLLVWTVSIEGYYVGHTAISSESARFATSSQSAKAA